MSIGVYVGEAESVFVRAVCALEERQSVRRGALVKKALVAVEFCYRGLRLWSEHNLEPHFSKIQLSYQSIIRNSGMATDDAAFY